MIAPGLPFELRYHELTSPEETIDLGGIKLKAFRVNHNITCYGYSLEVERAGMFDVERARSQEIPQRYWSRLQKGEVIEEDGVTYTPDMVLGAPRKGLKVTYTTDTRPCDSIVENAKGSDLFICEGMYGEEDKLVKAKEHKHMTFYEAAELAAKGDVTEMWLTHYSPSLNRPDEYLPQTRKIFPAAETCKDGKTIELVFEDEED
jgi:ribonuclease Z